MNEAKIVLNKGFYIGNFIKKKYIYQLPLYQITKGWAKFGVDSAMAFYQTVGNDKSINIGILDIEKDFRKTRAKIKNIEEIENLNQFEQINLYNSIGIWLHEQEFFNSTEKYISLFYYPIDLFYKDFTIKVYPIIKVYENNNILISYNIYFNEKISKKKFTNIANQIQIEPIIGVNLPTNFILNSNFKSEFATAINQDGVDIEYIHLKENDMISHFWGLTRIILLSFGIEEIPFIFYSRNFYLLDSTTITHNEISKLLNGCSESAKENSIGKDYRLFKDYQHYANTITTVVIGDNCLEHYPAIQSEEEHMIIQTIKDSSIFQNLVDNIYSYNELKSIQLDYMYQENNYFYSNYGEVSDIVFDLHKQMGRENRLKNINTTLDNKIKEKELFFQEKITMVLFLFSSIPIADYILIPLFNILYYKFDCFIKEPILDICGFLLSISLSFLLYKILNRKYFKK